MSPETVRVVAASLEEQVMRSLAPKYGFDEEEARKYLRNLIDINIIERSHTKMADMTKEDINNNLDTPNAESMVVLNSNELICVEDTNYKKLYEKSKIKDKDTEIEYLNAIINLQRNKSRNVGEKDEIIVMMTLFYLDKTKKYCELEEIFGKEASEGVELINIKENSSINNINDIDKTPGCYKADCKIKMRKTNTVYCASIKSQNGSYPTIVNHTPRTAKIFREGGVLHHVVPSFDKIIKEYIEKRNKKIIGEDVLLCQLDSVKDQNIKNDVKTLLSYFVFDGTGKGYSKCKANSIINYKNEEIIFINLQNSEAKNKYVEKIYSNVNISLRDKGMPKHLDNYCKPWLFTQTYSDGKTKLKGSMNMRIID